MEKENLKDREYLRSKFEDGDRPNGTDFAELIDSSLNQKSDRIFSHDRKIGIGVQRPKAPLEIRGGRRKVNQSLLASDGDNSSFRLAHPDIGILGMGANKSENLQLGNFEPDGSAFYPTATLDSNGRLGIGNLQPNQALDVNGSASISNSLFLGDCQLQFVNDQLILTSNGKKYEIQMKRLHRSPKKVLLWILISIGILLLVAIGIVIYLLIKEQQ